MERLLRAIRKNPDVVALLVVCATLGFGRVPELPTTSLRIHQLWQPQAQCLIESVVSRLPLFDL